MKKNALLLVGILFISALSALCFSACDKDTYCYLDVSVTDVLTKQPVADALVLIDMNGSSISDTGRTDNSGMYSTKFAAPAIFNVVVQKDTLDPLNPGKRYYRQGTKSIRLKEGETVTANVILEEEILD